MDQEFFLRKLASKEPAPGGGTASAIAGSMGAALVAMVAKLSMKGIPEAKKISDEAERFMETSSRLAKEDAKAFQAVVAAYKHPKNTEEEKSIRLRKIEEALKLATEIPLQSAKTSLHLMNLAHGFLTKANKNALSDMGVAVLLAKAAVQGSLLNVMINLASIKDQSFVEDCLEKTDFLFKESKNKEEEILKEICETLRFPFKKEPV